MIEDLALHNDSFRRARFTRQHLQRVVMTLQPGEEIGREVQIALDQFFHAQQGDAGFVVDDSEEQMVRASDPVAIPARTVHNVINASQTDPVGLYTLYALPYHSPGTIHRSKADAAAIEPHAGYQQRIWQQARWECKSAPRVSNEISFQRWSHGNRVRPSGSLLEESDGT